MENTISCVDSNVFCADKSRNSELSSTIKPL